MGGDWVSKASEGEAVLVSSPWTGLYLQQPVRAKTWGPETSCPTEGLFLQEPQADLKRALAWGWWHYSKLPAFPKFPSTSFLTFYFEIIIDSQEAVSTVEKCPVDIPRGLLLGYMSVATAP